MNWDDARGLWPHAGHSRFVSSAGRRWHIQEMGHGPVMLLLHGAGASTHSWRALLPDLAQDFRVVAPDLPGQGFTSPGPSGRCGLPQMSADIATLLDEQGLPPDVIVGHSAGAAIGLRLALDLPRTPAAVVCINAALENFRGPARSVFPALARFLSLTPFPAYALSRAARAPAMVRTVISSTGSTIDAAGIDLYRRLLSDSGHVDATLCMMANWDLAPLLDDLPRLAAPTLFIVGSSDRAVPPETSVRASRRIRDARTASLSGIGHLLHEEAPEEAARMIRAFVTSTAPTGA